MKIYPIYYRGRRIEAPIREFCPPKSASEGLVSCGNAFDRMIFYEEQMHEQVMGYLANLYSCPESRRLFFGERPLTGEEIIKSCFSDKTINGGMLH
jgi:hypothetical protein